MTSPEYIRANVHYKHMMRDGMTTDEASRSIYEKFGGKVFNAWLMAIASGLIKTDEIEKRED